MYSTCLFCQHALGRNDAVEAFPVGRRLAFDAAKGRLWVVCPACERWNLTALDERWEAIDACERLFRDTRVRMATDNIGLARLPNGLDLVRVGAPQRPEFAAWRYGDQLARRRRRADLLWRSGGLAAFGLAFAGGAWLGAAAIVACGAVEYAVWRATGGRRPDEIIARLPGRDACGLPLWRAYLGGVSVRGDGRELLVSVAQEERRLTFAGDDARRVVARVAPFVNRSGATWSETSAAVEALATAGGGDAFLASFDAAAEPRPLPLLPPVARLALEMAVHEAQERRAIEGELAELERAWREAEEIAAVADGLLLPSWLAERLDRLRGVRTGA